MSYLYYINGINNFKNACVHEKMNRLPEMVHEKFPSHAEYYYLDLTKAP